MLCDNAPEGTIILADKAYDSDGFIAFLEERGLGHCIPSKANRKNPRPHNSRRYKKRHRVENAFQRLKEFRAVATRYEKLSETIPGTAPKTQSGKDSQEFNYSSGLIIPIRNAINAAR
jgi:transposase